MNKEFPCKVCTHPAEGHYVNVTKESNICTDCLRAGDGRNYVDPSEYKHEFVGDNFKYLEMLDKREEIKNEQ
jgi:hypothetical protein